MGKIMNVFFSCSAFMVVGPLLMVLNKEILQTLDFDLPLTLSSLGLLTTAIVIRSLVAIGLCEVRQETLDAVARSGWYGSVLPIGAAKAITLATGNAVYLHLGIGFIQMLKAVTPVWVVALMFVFQLPLPTMLARWGVCLIVSGTMLEVKGERQATMVGLVLMFSSELCEALNLVLTQKLLHQCKLTVVEGLYMIAPPSGILLFSAAVVAEGPKIFNEGKYKVIVEFPLYFLANCALGFGVNFTGMAVVRMTSSLTCKILNTIRCIFVVLFGVLVYNEHCSTLELCGYAVALLGFCLYNFAQYRVDQQKLADSQSLLSEKSEHKGKSKYMSDCEGDCARGNRSYSNA